MACGIAIAVAAGVIKSDGLHALELVAGLVIKMKIIASFLFHSTPCVCVCVCNAD